MWTAPHPVSWVFLSLSLLSYLTQHRVIKLLTDIVYECAVAWVTKTLYVSKSIYECVVNALQVSKNLTWTRTVLVVTNQSKPTIHWFISPKSVKTKALSKHWLFENPDASDIATLEQPMASFCVMCGQSMADGLENLFENSPYFAISQ